MSGKVGLFTGSFDPVTLGHVDVIERASQLFETLYVGLFYNQAKQGFFEIAEREAMLKASLAHVRNVHIVTSTNELAVARARELGVTHLVRGLRNATDLEYESNLAFFNHELAPEIETVFLLSQSRYQYLSSSRIRELLLFQQDISPYVPQSVVRQIERKYENNQET